MNKLIKSQKFRFLINSFIVWFSTQLILHISLIYLSIPNSIFIAYVSYLPLGYYFYGYKVFNFRKFNIKNFCNYIFLGIILYLLNTFGSLLIHQQGINKNLSVLINMPFIAIISFYYQKYFVFKR